MWLKIFRAFSIIESRRFGNCSLALVGASEHYAGSAELLPKSGSQLEQVVGTLTSAHRALYDRMTSFPSWPSPPIVSTAIGGLAESGNEFFCSTNCAVI